ncbi:MAG: BglG family transcription antiterminator [Fusobacteriaceae bacterium]
MLNRKCVEIIDKIIFEKNIMTIKSLSEIFSVSERSIRYNLEAIDDYLTKNKIGGIKRVSKGQIEIIDIENIKLYLLKLKNEFKNEDLTQIEREEYILVNLIHKNGINIKELSEKLNISRTTVKNDLNDFLSKLKSKNIKLVVEHKKGLVLLGEEEEIRREFLNLIIKHYSHKNIKILISKELGIAYENKLKKLILKMEEKINSSITDEAYNIISCYLEISLGRIKCGKRLQKIANENFLEKTHEYENLKRLILELEIDFNINFGKFEILKLTDYFHGSHIYNPKFSYYENWVSTELLVQKILERFSHIYKDDFTRDLTLFEGVLNHIKPLIYRLKNNQKLENSIYKEVIESYPELFYQTKQSLEELEDFIDLKLTEDEIAFVLMHFKGAIDRKIKSSMIKKRVLLVCGLGYGTSNLLAQQLLDNYEVEITDIIPVHRFDTLDMKLKYDIIVTTVASNFFNTSKKVIEVAALLNEKDKENLKKNGFLNKNKKISLKKLMMVIEKNSSIPNTKKLKFELLEKFGDKIVNDIFENTELSKFLPLQNIKFEVESNSWQEAVKEGGKILLENSAITESYITNMIETVEKYGSYIVIAPRFAIPHSRNNGEVMKSLASLIRLKNPVIFPNNKSVSIIFTFSSIDNKEHLQALKELTEFITDKKLLEVIDNAKKEECVFKEIL